MLNSGYPSLADISAVVGNRDGAFGNGSDWIALIIILAVLSGGWGNGGFFGFGGNGGASEGYVLASDFANIERKIDTVNAGLCDGFYAMNTGMLNGFSNVQNAIQQSTVAGMQNTNALQTQIADCCCSTKQMLADINYNIATQGCATNNAIKDGVNAIIQNDNANYRAIHDEIVANRIEDYKTQIANQQAEINALQLSASQQCQNAYLLSQLRPQPVPSFPAQNLYGYYYGTTIA